MEKIGNFSTYGSIYEQSRTGKTATGPGAAAVKETASPSKAGTKVTLSDSAKNLLKELQKTYGNMDFIVADYETEEEAASYLARGTGEYSVLLTPDELEKMAADKDYKKQNLETLDNALAKLDEMKEQLGGGAREVKRIGIAIGDDGEISYFAELEKTNEKQRERIEKQHEDRREEAAVEKRAERVKRTTVFASSAEELEEKISRVNWETVREEDVRFTGSRFDFTV